MNHSDLIDDAARLVLQARRVTAFTGAGISVESGIPPFRGEGGLWNTYDASLLELDNFKRYPRESWELILELFYKHFGQARPNPAHYALARLEEQNRLQAIITQNIDNLHQQAGSKTVYEFHGSTQRFICLACEGQFQREEISLDVLPPPCPHCDGLIKPDIIFFGEAIPEPANTLSFREAELADLFIIIGSTGEVFPAALIPEMAKQNGAKIIEINIEASSYTGRITDIFLRGKASQMMIELLNRCRNGM